ncbi:transposable element Tc1 transposase [Trichonephila clavipes]|nr:transposable element Tc1 transposase [Trichonephila clavipes]
MDLTTCWTASYVSDGFRLLLQWTDGTTSAPRRLLQSSARDTSQRLPCRRIRAHYEKLSEFERGRMIGLKEAGWANWKIARYMDRNDTDVRRCWQEWVDSGRFQRHDGGNHADWRRIVFSDVYRFQLCPNNYLRRVWRSPEKRADPAFTIVHQAGPVPGVMQDNARPHTALVAMNCLTACQTLLLPARSPNLFPIEHVWDMMGRRLYLPGNVDDLA